MAFHKSNLGSFGHGIGCDMDGYIPEAGDGPWTLHYDHGTERTHDEDGNLTEYGEWWESERWPEIMAESVKATADSTDALSEWQAENH